MAEKKRRKRKSDGAARQATARRGERPRRRSRRAADRPRKAAAGRKPVRKACGPAQAPRKRRQPRVKLAREKPSPRRAGAPRERPRDRPGRRRPENRCPRASRPAVSRNRVRGTADSSLVEDVDPRGLGPEAGGQSGDTEGLSRRSSRIPESVEELLEEGQAFEAGIVSGVENAPAPQAGLRTRQSPRTTFLQEYLDED